MQEFFSEKQNDSYMNQPTTAFTANFSGRLIPSTPQPARISPIYLAPKSATPQPPKLKSGKHRKPSPIHGHFASAAPISEVKAPTPSHSVNIPMPVPNREVNHSPPSNPHLDELSSQLRMMLNIGSV